MSGNPKTDAAVTAIIFAIDDIEGLEFLRQWLPGEFDRCRKEWPDAPASVYLGADSLLDQTAPVRRPENVVSSTNKPNTVVEAITFAIGDSDGLDFLRFWLHGEFDVCRRAWPDAPASVYLAADVSFESTAPVRRSPHRPT